MAVSTEASGQAWRASRAGRAVRDLAPAYFALVMASGIVSIGTFQLGPDWLSRVLLVIASAGLVVLGATLIMRLAFFRASVAADIRAPDRVFGFFTIPAGLNVLGVRFALAGHPVVTAVLAGVAAAGWLVLTYGVPASLLLIRTRDSVVGAVNGNWLMWIVATQSLAVVAATLVPVWPSQSALLAPFAVGLWCVGLLLNLIVVALILLRWLSVPMTPATLTPPYWILMGATAITTLAGARDFSLPAGIAVVRATAGFVEGFTFAMWAFGTWWIPLLVILGLWRHLRHHWPLSYEPALWSVVFPLGMYSVATLAFGEAAHVTWMEPLARFMLWVAVAAWVLVAAAFLTRLARRPRHPAGPDPGAPAAPSSTSPAPPSSRLSQAWRLYGNDSSLYQFRWDKPDKSGAEAVITDRKPWSSGDGRVRGKIRCRWSERREAGIFLVR
jgi:tellurite resistance protein TehA-like permease